MNLFGWLTNPAPATFQCAGCWRFTRDYCPIDPACPFCVRCCAGHADDEEDEDA